MNLLNALIGSFINVGSIISIITTADVTFTGEIVELRGPVAPVLPPTAPQSADYHIILIRLTTAVSRYDVGQVVAIPASQIVSIG